MTPFSYNLHTFSTYRCLKSTHTLVYPHHIIYRFQYLSLSPSSSYGEHFSDTHTSSSVEYFSDSHNTHVLQIKTNKPFHFRYINPNKQHSLIFAAALWQLTDGLLVYCLCVCVCVFAPARLTAARHV